MHVNGGEPQGASPPVASSAVLVAALRALTASCNCTGLVNTKTVDISADGEAVKFSVARGKNASKPKASKAVYSLKKNARRVLKAVGKQVVSYRPDLKVRCSMRGAPEAAVSSMSSARSGSRTEQPDAFGMGNPAPCGGGGGPAAGLGERANSASLSFGTRHARQRAAGWAAGSRMQQPTVLPAAVLGHACCPPRCVCVWEGRSPTRPTASQRHEGPP